MMLPRREITSAILSCKSAFIGVALISGVVNVLYLTGSLFMLEVYDRVVPSRSLPTLVGLAGLALGLYAMQGVLDAFRGRLLVRIGTALDQALSPRVIEILMRNAPQRSGTGDGLLPLRDLDQIRRFLSGTGPQTLFDLPWLPIFVGICFLFHPLIGCAAVAGTLILVALTLLTELFTKSAGLRTVALGEQRNGLAEAARRNSEVIASMGMGPRVGQHWVDVNDSYASAQTRMADVVGGFGAVSKVTRMALQSSVLALGAYLVISGQATGGIMIASSILVARALAPAELAVTNWKNFTATRQSWRRLQALLERTPAQPQQMSLPRPSASLAVEDLSIAPPGHARLVVENAAFNLEAGQALGVIGPSASGKSSLARALVGVWAPVRGKVMLDGAALDQWPQTELGAHVGYLPQEAELFAGTLKDNIARFDPEATSEMVIAAARAAGAHDLILRLPNGYETRLGENGAGLSAGQRQRIGLARALYQDPFLVVLDEPNANLDAEGEQALTQAILGIRARGGICVLVAHRPSVLDAVDHVLMMAEGRVRAFGPKDEILKRVLRPTAVPASLPSSHHAQPGDLRESA
jgi:PrtD family type I secretion system ABC transporter